jgi:hypothetical protein
MNTDTFDRICGYAISAGCVLAAALTCLGCFVSLT